MDISLSKNEGPSYSRLVEIMVSMSARANYLSVALSSF